MNANKGAVAILEDDHGLRRDLNDFFRLRGVEVFACDNGTDFSRIVLERQPEVLIVDVLLGEENGLDIVRDLRSDGYEGGIVVLTALDDTQTAVAGYNSGADIYLSKRSDLLVIEACYRRLVSRGSEHQGIREERVDWVLDILARELRTPAGASVSLTGKEQEVLLCLMDKPGEVIERQNLVAADVRYLTPAIERRVDSVICRLRKKVKSLSGNDVPVEKVYGRGYSFASTAKVVGILDVAAAE